jgi:signal transduction histidine kinase
MAPVLPSRSRPLVVTAFVGAVALLLVVALASMDILSAARAFVGGESLWTKGQKAAVMHLRDYLDSGEERHYLRFYEALAVPLGDRMARLELDKRDPDYAVVHDGFVQGGNDPADIPGMVRLYRNFRDVSFMAAAIAAWTEGDALVAVLIDEARNARSVVASGAITEAQRRALIDRIEAADRDLTRLEMVFQAQLGDASRTTKAILQWATIGLALLLAAGGSVFIARTLSRQQLTERALRERNDQWNLAAQAGGIGVFDWDLASGRIVLDSHGRDLIGGVDATGDLDATRFARRMHRADEPALREAMEAAIRAAGPFAARCRLVLDDGQVRHVELCAHAREPGEDGRATRIVGIMRDRSADVNTEQLQLDKEAAERSASAKTAFLSRVSHELRTPLHAILGFAQLMQMDERDPLAPAHATRVRQLRASGEQLLSLVNDVLDLTRSDDADTAVGEVALAPVLEQSVERVEPLRSLHGVSLRGLDCVAGLHVQANATRLRQVLVNLLANAIVYNRSGGQVTVRCDVDDHEVRLSVHDTGPGLDGAQVAKLFQPFERLGAEFSAVKGSGLGLVTARQLLERMGGSIEVDSVPGVGSTFTARLRRIAPRASTRTEAQREPEALV